MGGIAPYFLGILSLRGIKKEFSGINAWKVELWRVRES
jgi:hypothetical protein